MNIFHVIRSLKYGVNGFVYGHPIIIGIHLLFSFCVRFLPNIRFHAFHLGSSEERKKKADRNKKNVWFVVVVSGCQQFHSGRKTGNICKFKKVQGRRRKQQRILWAHAKPNQAEHTGERKINKNSIMNSFRLFVMLALHSDSSEHKVRLYNSHLPNYVNTILSLLYATIWLFYICRLLGSYTLTWTLIVS